MPEVAGSIGVRVAHRAFEQPTRATTLSRARLTDKQRFGLLFQGAALLAHVRGAGLTIDSWSGARVSDEGSLIVATNVVTAADELPQVSLMRLLRIVFSEPTGIVGRGEARRAARSSKSRWSQQLVPINLDLVVAELLEEAPFLWLPAFQVSRRALAGKRSDRLSGDLVPWLVGPGTARRRLLRGVVCREEVEQRLDSDRLQDVWEGVVSTDDPAELVRQRQFRRANSVWRRSPPQGSRQLLMFAQSLAAVGKYRQALRQLRGHSTIAARTVRCACQLALGELNPAARTLRQVERGESTPTELLEIAETGVRVWALRGRFDRVREWQARVLALPGRQFRGRALAVAAGAAWDLVELDRMDEYLEELRELVESDSSLSAGYHRLLALKALAVGDGISVVDNLSVYLLSDRHRLSAAEAGRIWNDMAFGRALSGDLPGAEKACRHAVRLLSSVEGPSALTLALYNLAEVRLRRGRTVGVEQILARSTAENRRAGNTRGLIQDLELWARRELVTGQSLAALGRCAEALHEQQEQGVDYRREVFRVFMARANGWLGRRERAREQLELAGDEALAELEEEERPAVWALAGELERAAAAAAGTPWAEIWSSYVSDEDPRLEAWDQLRGLESFRAARLVLDCELTRPGSVAELWVQRALRHFYETGSVFAETLESLRSSPWRALGSYLADQRRGTAAAIAELFSACGYGDVELRVSGLEDRTLVAGKGGEQGLEVEVDDGSLCLRSERLDQPLEALTRVVARDLVTTGPVSSDAPRANNRTSSRLIGKSPAFSAVVERLGKLSVGELPILILGETGTGKELFSRYAHDVSARRRAPFLALNCAALPESLVQSELFGHVRGAFTGADRDRAGIFESANGGTVLLDEIGDLPLFAQGQLLRVLQEREVRRVGESFARRIDVRILAATHRDLAQMVKAGEFRQDLLFRLRVAKVELPPLRRRGDDVLLLAKHFLGDHQKLSSASEQFLLGHHWPGNVRELQNAIAVGSAMAGSNAVVQPEHFDIEHLDSPQSGSYHRRIHELKTKLVADAVASSAGNHSRAARKLGISRQALSYLVRQLGLFDSGAESAEPG